MTDSVTVDDALASFREMMSSDGYVLSWAPTGDDKVVVTIDATEGACEDCLVPLPIMTNIMSKALAPTAFELDHVVLPGKAH